MLNFFGKKKKKNKPLFCGVDEIIGKTCGMLAGSQKMEATILWLLLLTIFKESTEPWWNLATPSPQLHWAASQALFNQSSKYVFLGRTG